MSGAARQPRVTSRTQFPLSTHRVEIVEAEGAVQMVLLVDGFPAGPVRLANIFMEEGSADELQAVVDHLRGLT